MVMDMQSNLTMRSPLLSSTGLAKSVEVDEILALHVYLTAEVALPLDSKAKLKLACFFLQITPVIEI